MTSRRHARSLLDRLLVGASLCTGDFGITVELQGRPWIQSYPRPVANSSLPALTLPCSKGVINLAELHSMAHGPWRNAVAKTWWVFWGPSYFGQAANVTIPASQLIVDLSSRQPARPFSTQVMVPLAKEMETVFSNRAKRKQRPGGSVHLWLTFAWCTDTIDGSTSREVSPYVAAYVQNCVWEFQGVINFSLSTDKGWVNGLPLHDTVVCDGAKNLAALAPPAVVFVFFQSVSQSVSRSVSQSASQSLVS